MNLLFLFTQVVDGEWEIEPALQVVRTLQIGYDRLMTIGDRDMEAQYEVETTFELFSSSLTGIGFAMGWRGHKGKQACPSTSLPTTWPLEAITWIWRKGNLEIWTFPGKQSAVALSSLPGVGSSLVAGGKYAIKSRIEWSGGNNVVSTKFWAFGDTEPISWHTTATFPKNADNNGYGSILLLAHHTDVAFGPVHITPLSGNIFGGRE